MSDSPPEWTNSPWASTYINEDGDKWIAVPEPGLVRFTGSDIGWETKEQTVPLNRDESKAMNNALGGLPDAFGGIMLNQGEAFFLYAVARVAGKRRK